MSEGHTLRLFVSFTLYLKCSPAKPLPGAHLGEDVQWYPAIAREWLPQAMDKLFPVCDHLLLCYL